MRTCVIVPTRRDHQRNEIKDGIQLFKHSRRVDKTNEPLVFLRIGAFTLGINVEIFRERKVGAVGAGLVPTSIKWGICYCGAVVSGGGTHWTAAAMEQIITVL